MMTLIEILTSITGRLCMNVGLSNLTAQGAAFTKRTSDMPLGGPNSVVFWNTMFVKIFSTLRTMLHQLISSYENDAKAETKDVAMTFIVGFF